MKYQIENIFDTYDQVESSSIAFCSLYKLGHRLTWGAASWSAALLAWMGPAARIMHIKVNIFSYSAANIFVLDRLARWEPLSPICHCNNIVQLFLHRYSHIIHLLGSLHSWMGEFRRVNEKLYNSIEKQII